MTDQAQTTADFESIHSLLERKFSEFQELCQEWKKDKDHETFNRVMTVSDEIDNLLEQKIELSEERSRQRAKLLKRMRDN